MPHLVDVPGVAAGRTDDAELTTGLAFDAEESFVGLKHKNSIAVARRLSWRVRFTPSNSFCKLSPPVEPGRREYAADMELYMAASVFEAAGDTY